MKLSDDVVWRFANDDQVLLLSLANEHYFELNSSASFLWKELNEEGTHTQSSLVRALSNNFGIDTGTADCDVGKFLDSLRAIGCLVDDADEIHDTDGANFSELENSH
jgi:Coenzyme PQQ synthesis protein D (PqqD)